MVSISPFQGIGDAVKNKNRLDIAIKEFEKTLDQSVKVLGVSGIDEIILRADLNIAFIKGFGSGFDRAFDIMKESQE